MFSRQFYADVLFNLPVEQVKLFSELSDNQQRQAKQKFGPGRRGYESWMYVVKKNGDLVSLREPIEDGWKD